MENNNKNKKQPENLPLIVDVNAINTLVISITPTTSLYLISILVNHGTLKYTICY